MTIKERFDEIINDNIDGVIAEAQRMHIKTAKLIDILFRKYEYWCRLQEAGVSSANDNTPHGNTKSIREPLTPALEELRSKFAKWYGLNTRFGMDSEGNEMKPNIRIDKEIYGYNDSLQDAMMYYYENPSKIPTVPVNYPTLEENWKAILLTRAKNTRQKRFTKEAGLTSKGECPKKHKHSTYATLVTETEDDVPIRVEDLPDPGEYRVETKIVKGRETVTFE